MTKTLAIEWGPYNGIRVNCVAPGLIISSGMKNYHETMVDLLAYSHWMVSPLFSFHFFSFSLPYNLLSTHTLDFAHNLLSFITHTEPNEPVRNRI
jgi:hypothetical protein